MFTCTGSEANDLAVRIAEVFTGGQGIVVTETAYHGITHAVARFSPSLGSGVALGSHVRTVPAPDSYRSPTGDVAPSSQPACRPRSRPPAARHQARPVHLRRHLFQ